MAKKKSPRKKKNTNSSAQKRQPLEAANVETGAQQSNVAVSITVAEDRVEATPMGAPPPVGVNYYAISPEDNFTSAHQMKHLTFTNIFDLNTATAFEELFPD